MKKFIIYSVSALFFIVLISFNVVQVQEHEILIGKGTANANFNVTVGNDGDRRSALYVNNNTSVTTGGADAIYAYQKPIAGNSVAVRATVGTTYFSNAYTYGVLANSGYGMSGYNYGVYGLLQSSNYGAAVYGSDYAIAPWYIPGRYAGFFNGNVYMSECVGIGTTTPRAALEVQGNVYVNGTLTTGSDARIKTNIKDLKSSMELIEKLRPVTYNFKPYDYAEYREILEKSVPDSVVIKNDDDLRKYFSLGNQRDVNRKHIGFIAQELKEVFPELVYEDKKGSLSVDYISLIPVLVGTIQEMNEQIQTLNKRIEALENKNTIGNNL